MGLLKEFREFAVRGNVIDLAVGVVIGAAFGRIVSSLVENVIMPPLGLVTGGVDFSNLQVILRESPDPKGVVALRYGAFIQSVVDFLLVAAAIFALVKVINRLHRRTPPPPAAPAPPSAEVTLLTEIRDALVKKG
jgi:large conductance mechanosensitive channel